MMKKIYRCFGITVLVLFSCIMTYAQRHPVSGTVKNESGSPMPGVNILLKGTTSGVSTDSNGKFVLQALPEDVLEISFIGYLTEQIPVRNQTHFDINILPDITKLTEVVVIGYGESKRKDVTGSISSITGTELRKTNPVTFDQALQGKVPGVVQWRPKTGYNLFPPEIVFVIGGRKRDAIGASPFSCSLVKVNFPAGRWQGGTAFFGPETTEGAQPWVEPDYFKPIIDTTEGST